MKWTNKSKFFFVVTVFNDGTNFIMIMVCSKLHTVWFVCKILCFFDFLVDDSETGQPTHLVLGEAFEGASDKHASNVPRVKETITSNRKFVAFDASDLISPVSLLQEVTSIQSASNFQVYLFPHL